MGRSGGGTAEREDESKIGKKGKMDVRTAAGKITKTKEKQRKEEETRDGVWQKTTER